MVGNIQVVAYDGNQQPGCSSQLGHLLYMGQQWTIVEMMLLD